MARPSIAAPARAGAKRRSRRVDVCVATSGGGHLELLRAVERAWARHDHVVVAPAERAAAVARDGHRVAAVPEPGRRPAGVARAALRALRLALRLRPRVVLTAGAGAALPFCLAARALGARLVFVETMARVSAPSASGRVLGRVAHHAIVQWPELARALPGARVCRPALLEPAGGPPAPPGAGTFVAVGTHGEPFDRLLRLADDAVAAGVLPAPARAQTGACRARPRALVAERTLPPRELERAVRAAELVVCHGGSGIMALAVRAGRRPLVLARRRALGEHVDDHQVATVAKLASLGLVVSLDEHPLARAVALAREPAAPAPLEGEPLGEVLAELVDAELERAR